MVQTICGEIFFLVGADAALGRHAFCWAEQIQLMHDLVNERVNGRVNGRFAGCLLRVWFWLGRSQAAKIVGMPAGEVGLPFLFASGDRIQFAFHLPL